MIKFVACSLPNTQDDLEMFVSYNDLLWWFTYEPISKILICGKKPGRSVEECLAAFGRGFDTIPEIKEENVEFISDDIKTKVLSYIMKQKQKFIGQSKWYKEQGSQNL